MTTTTPTTALADLDLDKIDTSAHCGLGASPVETLKLTAIARRAAQPVAPVLDVLTIPTAIMDIACDHRLHDEYKRGHRDARHAAADLVLARADELKALATPSPQIAEVAELPPLLGILPPGIEKNDPKLLIHVSVERLARILRQYARDAIAASRRAAGGEVLLPAEPTDALLVACGWEEWRSGNHVDRGAATARYNAIRAAAIATSAPASAGQAECPCPKVRIENHSDGSASCVGTCPGSAGQASPAMPDTQTVKMLREAADIMVELADNHRAVSQSSIAWMESYLPLIDAMEDVATQPAEGAGQAEASQAGRQYQRKVDEKIIARRDAEIASLRAGQAGQVADWQECERISDLPSVNEAFYNFSQDSTADNAICIVRAVLEALPVTQRAAAPAEQSSAKESQA